MVTNEKSQRSLMTLVSWHYLALGDEKAVRCNAPCFMSITPTESRRVEQVPMLQLESCELKQS